jgi:tetratricopeptide (TPR) repeat protein
VADRVERRLVSASAARHAVDDGSESDATATVEGAEEVPEAAPERPRTIGRYVVLDRLGAGAMALVLAAYDAELDRPVALKLVHPRSSSINGRPRLLKEAQSLAQLAHPNVVTIYDVGTHGAHVYLAMELVQGGTLKAWLRAGGHAWGDVLERFVAAGRGLAAAHAAGIVHRDFKPDNVLLGEDGRPRVADFGLATAAVRDEPYIPRMVAETISLLDQQLTATGMVVGTPAYMAPEQMAGRSIDARADQFSFCVALHEALFGERVRVDPDEPHRFLAPVASPLGPARGAPRWLRRVLARGMAIRPRERWPSMDALLREIVDRAARRRRIAVFALGGALLGALFGAKRIDRAEVASCERAAEAGGRVWTQAARDRVEQAITSTALAHADDTWQRVGAGLDEYAARWTAMYVASCGNPDPIAAEATRTCLARRRGALRAAVDVLADSDARVVDRAARVVAGLPALDDCADPERASAPVPADPALAADVERTRDELQRAAALEQAGRWPEGIALARELAARADAIEYAPLAAEAALQLGSLLEQSGDVKAAEPVLARAVALATAEDQPATAALAMIRVIGAVGYHQARIEEGLWWSRHAEAWAARAGLDRRERVLLRNNTAAVLFRVGDYDGAGAIYEQNIAMLEDPPPRSIAERQELANALNNLGNVYARRNMHDLSARTLERAVTVLGELLGTEHPNVAITLANLGNMRYDQGELESSRIYLERALEVLRRSVGDGHPAVASTLGNLGLVLARLGDGEAGRRRLEESVQLKRARLGDDHPDVAHSLNNLGEIVREQGDVQAAAELHREAAEIWMRVDPEHPYATYPIANLGLDLLELGEIEAGLAYLRRTEHICATKQVDPTVVATTAFGLARALWHDPSTRPQALGLARDAARSYADIGGRYLLERDRIAAWLAERE